MGPHVFFVLFNSNHQVALHVYRCTVYHGTAAICISIELYEIVQLRSGDGVALPLMLSLIVGVVGLTLRGDPLIRSKKKKKDNVNFIFYFSQKIC